MPLFFSFVDRAPSCTIRETATAITTDNLKNVYLINGESIRKFDSSCTFQKEFSNKDFGNITSADATNPLRIVLFYRDFNRVVFLDNTMSQNGDAVQLESLGFPLASLAASSHDNGLWIYDQANFELIRFNRNMQIEQRTGNLAQLLGIDLQPDFMMEKGDRLYLNNPATGIIVFDVFGTYSKTIPVKGLRTFQATENTLFYMTGGNLVAENILTLETISYEEPTDANAIDIRKESNRFYVLLKDATEIY